MTQVAVLWRMSVPADTIKFGVQKTLQDSQTAALISQLPLHLQAEIHLQWISVFSGTEIYTTTCLTVQISPIGTAVIWAIYSVPEIMIVFQSTAQKQIRHFKPTFSVTGEKKLSTLPVTERLLEYSQQPIRQIIKSKHLCKTLYTAAVLRRSKRRTTSLRMSVSIWVKKCLTQEHLQA